MAKNKKKSIEDRFFPVQRIPSLAKSDKVKNDPEVIRKIIQGAVQGAFQVSNPSSYDIKYKIVSKPLVSNEQIQFVTHLIESLEPASAIEAALASQFAISYIRGLKGSHSSSKTTLELFEFGHKVLEALQKFRTKGAQLINVQYNHQQNQINTFKISNEENSQRFVEVKNEI